MKKSIWILLATLLCACAGKQAPYYAINHRGYSAEAPENTLPAYQMSKAKGFTYVECDVSFTKDGVPVLLHDHTIDRTSNGSGRLSDLTLEQVRQFDFGSWKDSVYVGTTIPTYAEFIAFCKSEGLHPFIELKANGEYTQEMIAQLVQEVREAEMLDQVTWISFRYEYLQYVNEFDPTAHLGYLNHADATAELIAKVEALRNTENEVFLSLNFRKVTDEGMECAKQHRVPVMVYTVNSWEDVNALHPYISGCTSDSILVKK